MASNCGGASNLVSGRGMHESLEHGNTFANSNMIHSSETEQETGETRVKSLNSCEEEMIIAEFVRNVKIDEAEFCVTASSVTPRVNCPPSSLRMQNAAIVCGGGSSSPANSAG